MDSAVRLRRSSVSANLAASYAGRIVAGVLGFVFPPFFARVLGAEGYGLVGFFTSLTVVLTVLDVGLSATLQREMAVVTTDPAPDAATRAASLVKTFASAFWLMGAAIGVGIIVGAPVLAERWLHGASVPRATEVLAVRAMGVAIALQWPASIYGGVLLGAEQQVRSNIALVVTTTIRFAGGALVLATVSPTIEAFFAWQIVSAAAQVLLARHLARAVVPSGGSFDFSLLRRLWRFSAGVWVVSVLSIGTSQADKVIGSHTLPLGVFGDYSLAAAAATGMVHIVAPLWATYYPRLCALASRREGPGIDQAYHQGAQLMTVMVAPACSVFAAFAPDILLGWTGNADIAARLRWPATFLVVGTAANGFMFLPFAAQLANGLTRVSSVASAASLVVMMLLLPSLASSHGGSGLAAGWALITAGHAATMAWLTHARILRGQGLAWLGVDVARPLLGAGMCALLARAVLPLAATRAGGLANAALAYAPALLLAALLAPAVRTGLRARLGAIRSPSAP